jgi:hypothetical protein
MQFLHSRLSISAVEKSPPSSYLPFRERDASDAERSNYMRIFETAAAGMLALAAQILVVATAVL